MPARILEKHVGGNTTYARSLEREFSAQGVIVERFGIADNPYKNIVAETAVGLRTNTECSVLHYVADTGPVVKTRKPSVVTVHGIASHSVQSIRSPLMERVWRTRVGRAIKSCDRVITVSNSSARDIEEVFSYPREKITVIPHGLNIPDVNDLDASDSVKEIVMKSQDYILYVGNLEPRKNLVNLIRAMEDRRLSDYRLVIAGRPAWDYEPIIRAIDSSSSVDYLGFVTDADRDYLMKKCKLFAFPSLYEGFGFPVLEAMATGTPVICSDRGSLAEVGGPALRFTGLESDAIATDLYTALASGSELERVGVEGPRWAEKFSWKASADAHLSLYRELT